MELELGGNGLLRGRHAGGSERRFRGIAQNASNAEATRANAQALVRKYGNLSLRVAYTYLGNRADAEDVSQDVLVKLITHDAPFASSEHERAWVIRCTINACKDLLKSASRKRVVALDSVAEPNADEASETFQNVARESNMHANYGPENDEPENAYDESEGASDEPGEVTRAVMQLPTTYREAIYLRYFEQMSIHQIALALNASDAAITKRLSRARAELRKLLTSDSSVSAPHIPNEKNHGAAAPGGQSGPRAP